MVQDETVIELIYVNNTKIPHNYRWEILRTRWDKTESVMRHQRKYGNFKDVAIKTWKSMKESVTLEEIRILSKPELYLNQRQILQSRLDSQIISTDRMQDKYYQKTQTLAKKLGWYHNFIKSNLIYTYCRERLFGKKSKSRRQSVLDIGCGRGGDLLKWYHSRVGYYVGIDISYQDLHSASDGIISRYNQNKKRYPGWGKYDFIHGSGGVLLNSIDQEKKIGKLTKENKQLIDRIFTPSRKFDIINSSFAIHYMFENDDSLNNLTKNINQYLKKYGFILFTLFDGNKVLELIGDKDKYVSHYTDDEGKRNVYFEIRKKNL